VGLKKKKKKHREILSGGGGNHGRDQGSYKRHQKKMYWVTLEQCARKIVNAFGGNRIDQSRGGGIKKSSWKGVGGSAAGGRGRAEKRGEYKQSVWLVWE